MSLEKTVKETKPEKVKKDKEYSIGMLMKRWYENVKDPFDSVIYGSKCTTYAIHQTSTLKRQSKDRKEKYNMLEEKVNDRMQAKEKIIHKLEKQYEKADNDKKEGIHKKIFKYQNDNQKLRKEVYDIREKRDPWNGWSTLACLVTIGGMGAAYTVGTAAAVATLGPIGYGVTALPVFTQLGSHVRESFIKARRDLKKEYQDDKKDVEMKKEYGL